MEPQPIINRVAQSALVTIDLADFFPAEDLLSYIDLKDYLFKGLILREEEFRATVKSTDWSAYSGRFVVIHSSADAIIPMWVYMILGAELAPFAADIACAPPAHAQEVFLYHRIAELDASGYAGARITIKGCGDKPVPEAAFAMIAQKLAKVAKSIMYGEPCSTVPVFKKMQS